MVDLPLRGAAARVEDDERREGRDQAGDADDEEDVLPIA